MGTLFPEDEVEPRVGISIDWDPELEVTPTELVRTFRRISYGKAPGPDGLFGRILKLAGELLRCWAACFDTCL